MSEVPDKIWIQEMNDNLHVFDSPCYDAINENAEEYILASVADKQRRAMIQPIVDVMETYNTPYAIHLINNIESQDLAATVKDMWNAIKETIKLTHDNP